MTPNPYLLLQDMNLSGFGYMLVNSMVDRYNRNELKSILKMYATLTA
jgi:hypothetical protein